MRCVLLEKNMTCAYLLASDVYSLFQDIPIRSCSFLDISSGKCILIENAELFTKYYAGEYYDEDDEDYDDEEDCNTIN